MEKASQIGSPGSRQMNLKRSFKLGIRSLLTGCSLEDFSKAFPGFTNAEHDRLHRLFIQVITSLHGNIEDEFESLCLETQVETVLDTVEQLVEEQSLDLLFSENANVGDTLHCLSAAKKNEIQYLMDMLKKFSGGVLGQDAFELSFQVEEQKCIISARVELLRKETQDFSGAADAIEKQYCDPMIHN